MKTVIIRPPLPAAVSAMPADSMPMLCLDCIRSINLIVIHCTASRCDRRLTPDELEAEHCRRNFNGCGYHFFISRDGIIEPREWIKQCPCFDAVKEYAPFCLKAFRRLHN